MKSCSSCHRHLRRAERACPFCGTPTKDTAAPLCAVLSLASVLVGCTEEPPGDPTTSGADSTTTVTLSGSGAVDPSTSAFSTTAVDTDDTATDSSGGGGFIYGLPDSGGGDECDLFAQDCPKGEKCMPWANDGGNSWNAITCSPVADNPGEPGDPCTVEGSAVSGVDDCQLGAMCWDVDPRTDMGTCVAMCTGSREMPFCDEPGTTCAIANDGVLILCLPACDPLDGDQACPPGQGCFETPNDNGFICTPEGKFPGSYGESCENIGVCQPGLLCVVPEAVPGCMSLGCCTEMCSLSDPLGDAQCTGQPQGQQCVPYYEDDPPPEYVDLGICTLPM